METIQQSLLQSSVTNEFSISYNGKKIEPVECEIRFVFITLKKSSTLGYLFMPDYKPVINKNSKSLTLNPIKTHLSQIVFYNQSEQILNLWDQFISNSNGILTCAYDCFVQENDLPFEQNVGNNDHPYVLKVSSDFVFSCVDADNEIFSYQLTDHTNIITSNLDEPPNVGLFESEDPKPVKYILIPDLKSIFSWIVFLKCCVNIASKNKSTKSPAKSKLRDLFKPTDDDEQSSTIDTTQKETNQRPPSNEIHFESILTSSESKAETSSLKAVPCLDSTSKSDNSSISSRRTRTSSADRKLSCDMQTINSLALDVEKKKRELANLKQKYVKTVNIPEPIIEPLLPPPAVANINGNNTAYQVVSINKQDKMTREEFCKLIHKRIHSPLVNFYHYMPNYQFLTMQIPEVPVEYISEEKCPQSFENLFYYSLGIKKSDTGIQIEKAAQQPSLTFLLLCSILTNGLKNSSLCQLFHIPTKIGNKIKNEVFDIMKKYQDKIFEYILSLSNKQLEDNYESWSILISNNAMITSINQTILDAKSSTPVIQFSMDSTISDFIPFQYPLKPFHSIQNYFFNILYHGYFTTLDTRNVIIQLSSVLWGLFNHYMVFSFNSPSSTAVTANDIAKSSVNLFSFTKEVMTQISALMKTIPPWSLLKNQQDFYNVWIQFWAISFQQDKLVSNFAEFFKYPDLIKKYYYPCSGMRHQAYLKYVAEFLNAILQLKLSKDFDTNFRSGQNEKTILKNFADRIKFK